MKFKPLYRLLFWWPAAVHYRPSSSWAYLDRIWFLSVPNLIVTYTVDVEVCEIYISFPLRSCASVKDLTVPQRLITIFHYWWNVVWVWAEERSVPTKTDEQYACRLAKFIFLFCLLSSSYFSAKCYFGFKFYCWPIVKKINFYRPLVFTATSSTPRAISTSPSRFNLRLFKMIAFLCLRLSACLPFRCWIRQAVLMLLVIMGLIHGSTFLSDTVGH